MLIMTCRLFVTKPSSEPAPLYYYVHLWEQTPRFFSNPYLTIFKQENDFENVSASFRFIFEKFDSVYLVRPLRLCNNQLHTNINITTLTALSRHDPYGSIIKVRHFLSFCCPTIVLLSGTDRGRAGNQCPIARCRVQQKTS